MPTLGTLIEEVEASSPTNMPLDLLATASAAAQNIDEVTDAMLSHFVDKCRRSGHSWAEIGTALGVTKQAVQKRFTNEPEAPMGFERYTARAQRLVAVHAPAAAASLGHNWVGTEHLLLGFYEEPEALAPVILLEFGLDRDKVVAGIDARIERGLQAEGSKSGFAGLTPRAKVALNACSREALMLGHNYVGTEHQLLSLLSGVGGVGADILADANITHDRARAKVIERLAQFIQKKAQP